MTKISLKTFIKEKGKWFALDEHTNNLLPE